ncbi:MAG: hypothetical protein A2W21_08680 [Betaproteobacteria bacterium RBG_16_66_20]|nr:MAG: hypothetical protein A2W21_08680 [Betaproteobacteria bacterium RBG_16_66_20]
MRKKQLGVGLGGLMAGAVILIALAMLGLKLTPSYIEFFAIKKAVNAIASEKAGGASVAEIRKSFDARATIDDISSVKAADLEITKEGNELVIAARYRKEIPLVANVGVYIEFAAVSKE